MNCFSRGGRWCNTVLVWTACEQRRISGSKRHLPCWSCVVNRKKSSNKKQGMKPKRLWLLGGDSATLLSGLWPNLQMNMIPQSQRILRTLLEPKEAERPDLGPHYEARKFLLCFRISNCRCWQVQVRDSRASRPLIVLRSQKTQKLPEGRSAAMVVVSR